VGGGGCLNKRLRWVVVACQRCPTDEDRSCVAMTMEAEVGGGGCLHKRWRWASAACPEACRRCPAGRGMLSLSF
jgi:hypothetical protein